MPGVRCIRAETDGGRLGGGAPRAVWLTLGADPRAVSVCSVAQRLIEENRPCHLVWDPLTGELAQLLPIVRAGCVLGTPESDPAARIQALLLISSLLAFQSGRSISLRTMHWSTIGPKELTMVLSSLEAQIDALGRRQS